MYANVIVDISAEKLDKTFQYRIPETLAESVQAGVRVEVTFGNSTRTAYVLEVTECLECPEEKLKDIAGIVRGSVPVEGQLIELAVWMREQYGSTMNQALKTVLPVKRTVKKKKPRVEREELSDNWKEVTLNEEQRIAADGIWRQWSEEKKRPQFLFGITGSGKTEVYMELIARVLEKGRQAIVLIPEISLTYQTISRFAARFGDKVGIVNSRLSAGEKYECFEKAKTGEISVMIGPRSALFTPFRRLGIILVDEEHEGAYKSEPVPKYHAREVAIKRAELAGAIVVFGSATPSVASYYRVKAGEYDVWKLKNRAKQAAMLPKVSVVDLREELKQGNKTIFSLSLQEKIKERLEKKQQIMLFLNKRGYAGFISCRSCGAAMRCPHCDVSLTSHNNGQLVCHYCGYRVPFPKLCPECGSPYIAAFGTGTQKVEAMIKKMFPEARVLRMDLDTTSKKTGHERILRTFAEGKADILIGTQMIVKGHDFPKVTLVGVLAADLSLHASDYSAAERTFALLTQAAGRAGRGETPGDVIIQTYQPDHYSIITAAKQDYPAFYEQEISYRAMLGYPPVWSMCAVLVTGSSQEDAQKAAGRLAAEAKRELPDGMQIIGPAAGCVSKINDVYRQVLYLKHRKKEMLIAMKDRLELLNSEFGQEITVQFDFNPESPY